MTARKEAVMKEHRCRRGRGREGTPREEAVTKRKGAVLELLCLPGWQLVQSFLFRNHIEPLQCQLTQLHLQHSI